MIDRLARDKAALAIRRYASNRITNFELENSFEPSNDPALWAIENEMWLTYDDLNEHKAGDSLASKSSRREIAKLIVFLKSGQAYIYPSGGYPSKSFLNQTFNILTLGWAEKRRLRKKTQWDSVGSIETWPFQSQAHLKTAIDNFSFT